MASKKANKVAIVPLPDKKSIQSIRLDFSCASQSEPIPIELPAHLAKSVAEAILEVLDAGNSPSQPTRAPSCGRVKLRIVKT
jgi:hypothetical protein